MSGIIGLLDSGIGGLTTLCQCIKAYPNKDYIYIADTLHAPYGDKSGAFLLQRANELIKQLKERHAKVVILACNSCSSATVMQQEFCLPVIRVLPPVESVLQETTGKVLLLGTPVTISSQYISNKKHKRLTKLPNGILASLVERHAPNFYKLKNYLREYLQPFSNYQAIILGCTHYLYLEELIFEILPDIKIYHTNTEIFSQLSAMDLGIGYRRREIILTGEGDKNSYFSLLNGFLNG